MTLERLSDLEALEAVIERGLHTFVEVGQALLAIRDGRLYRTEYGDFDTYCRERWGWSRQRSDQLIAASEVAGILTTAVVTPASERQARELAPLVGQPLTMGEAWRDAVERYGERVTAANVRESVQRHIAPAPEPEPPPYRLAPLMTSESPEWYTPQAVIVRVQLALGSIDLDPCSNQGAPNVPAARHFTEADDGLAQHWGPGTVYMNPPYGRGIGDWVVRLVGAFETSNISAAIALLPARTDTAWFRKLNRFLVCFIDGRLKFSDYENSAPFPSAVVYLGNEPRRFFDAFADTGAVYRPVHFPEDV